MMKSSLALITAALLAAGCAQFGSVTSDVSSYGEWPAERKAGSYAFERLPSQESSDKARAHADALEKAAQPALVKAGFTPAAAGQTPDVIVQLGYRATRYDRSPWADPIWWRGGFGYWRPAPWGHPRWAAWQANQDVSRYESEVALLVRDRASGKPLFETRASSESLTRDDAKTLQAMFSAAMMDFPKTGISPRRVTVMPPA